MADEDQDFPRLHRRPNTGDRATHKAWLARTLAGGPSRVKKNRRRIRKLVLAVNSATHIGTLLVAWILRQEYERPSIPAPQPTGPPRTLRSSRQHSTRSSFTSTVDFLQHDTGARGGSSLHVLFEEAIRYAERGRVEETRGGQGPGPRQESQHLIRLHGPAFRHLFAFTPSPVNIPRGVIQAAAAQWASAYQSQIQEHLFSTLLHIVNVAANTKEARRLRKTESGRKRMSAIQAYKTWLRGARTDEPELEDQGVHKAHGIISPLLLNTSGWLANAIEQEPSGHTRPALTLPIRRSFIPGFIQLDGDALKAVCGATSADGISPFSHVFKTGQRPLGNSPTQKWRLDASVVTDGYAIGVHKALTSAGARSKAQRGRSSRGSARLRRAAGVAEFSSLDSMSDEEVLSTRGRAVFLDPGKRELLYAVGEHSTSAHTDSGKSGCWRYTAAARRRALGTELFRRRTRQMERRLPPDVGGQLNDFRQWGRQSTRGFSTAAIAALIRHVAGFFDTATKIYSQPLFRTQRMLAWQRQQREQVRIAKQIKATFGADAVLFFGDWSQTRQLPGSAPTKSGHTLIHDLHQAGFEVHTIDEFRTSSFCPSCTSKLSTSPTKQPSARMLRRRWNVPVRPWELKVCSSDECREQCSGGRRHFSRNLVGAANLRLIWTTRIAHIFGVSVAPRPAHLSRGSAPAPDEPSTDSDETGSDSTDS
ncbi:hypothetical protein OC834_007248 [Tilletia horrida]|nr:hypothetical protein OC834_007248 [Tilletia horrida]